MANKDIVVRKISDWRFFRKLNDLDYDVRTEILEFIDEHKFAVDHFEFGRVPGRRIYRVVLFDGNKKEWTVSKNRPLK